MLNDLICAVKLTIKEYEIQIRKYKLLVIFTFIIAPILILTDYFFRGSFVGFVNYYGVKVHYFEFLLIGWIVISIGGYVSLSVNYILHKHHFALMFQVFVWAVIRNFIKSIPFFIILTLIGFPLWYLILLIISTFLILSAFSFGISYIMSSIKFFIRGEDFYIVREAYSKIQSFILPFSFAVSATGFLKDYLIYIPSVSLVEGIRMFIFGLDGSYYLFLGCILSIIFFAISYLIFEYSFYIARREGYVLLR